MSDSVKAYPKLPEEYRNWLRLFTFIDSAGRTLCQNILHEKEKVPDDGKEFYSILQNYQNEIQFRVHEEILCPSDQFIDESKFDLLIYMMVIQMMYGNRYQDVIQDLRNMQNQLSHIENRLLSAEDFEKWWICAWNVFQKYGLNDNNKNFLNYIKTWEQSSAEECKGILKFLSFCLGLSQYLNRLEHGKYCLKLFQNW